MKSIYDSYTLNNGVKNPCVGFGTFKAADGQSAEVLKTAVDAGYRYFDTASFYETEESLGKAVREKQIPREELFMKREG